MILQCNALGSDGAGGLGFFRRLKLDREVRYDPTSIRPGDHASRTLPRRADLPQPPAVVDCARARARGAQKEWLRGVRRSAAEGLRCIQRSAAPRGARMSRSADPERGASDNTTLPEKLQRNLPGTLANQPCQSCARPDRVARSCGCIRPHWSLASHEQRDGEALCLRLLWAMPRTSLGALGSFVISSLCSSSAPRKGWETPTSAG